MVANSNRHHHNRQLQDSNTLAQKRTEHSLSGRRGKSQESTWQFGATKQMKRRFYTRGNEWPVFLSVITIFVLAGYIAYRYWQAQKEGKGIADIIDEINPIKIKEERESPLITGLKWGSVVVILLIVAYFLFSKEFARWRSIVLGDIMGIIYGPGGISKQEDIDELLTFSGIKGGMSYYNILMKNLLAGKKLTNFDFDAKVIVDKLKSERKVKGKSDIEVRKSVIDYMINKHEELSERYFTVADLLNGIINLESDKQIKSGALKFLKDNDLLGKNFQETKENVENFLEDEENQAKLENVFYPRKTQLLIEKLANGEKIEPEEFFFFNIKTNNRSVLEWVKQNLENGNNQFDDDILRVLEKFKLYNQKKRSVASVEDIDSVLQNKKEENDLQKDVHLKSPIIVRFKSLKAAVDSIRRAKRFGLDGLGDLKEMGVKMVAYNPETGQTTDFFMVTPYTTLVIDLAIIDYFFINHNKFLAI